MVVGPAHHYGVNVSDIDRSIEFYRDVLGLEVLREEQELSDHHEDLLGVDGTEGTFAVLGGNGFKFELKSISEPSTKNINAMRRPVDIGDDHFCWEVEDIDATYEELTERGVEFLGPPKSVGTVDSRVAYFYDPDGNVLELVEPGS
ncbi:VOC family protein [Haloarcula salinisoli]|uniref:VOC family protein n=1 Tax=Haloarcula salinisoli TaxID=2487746 RepID=A0A8J7YQH3_9EURY|nr:VOC family protein [Halomicroarcula salinisoli]MBX0288599.1 VOC family protein [Halomicroarcula salinisoli]MBX0306021.1 VOC family protein [Halomicroarcula salinisoli]